MLQTYEQNSKKKLLSTIVAILVIAGTVVVADHLKSEDGATGVAQTGTATIQTSASAAASAAGSSTSNNGSSSATYKNGTYIATSDYYVPHGYESIKVTLTLNNGVITDSSVQNSEGDYDSMRYQEDFAAAYKNYVVGQKISGLSISTIAGASDTTQGFNDALSQIASKAQT
ncbi:hypothetical protein BH09PAT4_BH09PAT4_00350 [soil metagenome]